MTVKLAVALRDEHGTWRHAICDLPIESARTFRGALTIHIGDGLPMAAHVMPAYTVKPIPMERRVQERREHVTVPLK